MIVRVFRRRLLAALLLSGFAAAATAAQPPLLVSLVPGGAAAKAASGDRVLSAIRAEPATDTIESVAVQAAHLTESTPALDLQLAPGRSIRAHQDYAYANPDGTVVWSGRIEGLDDPAARLRRFGDAEALEASDASVLIVRNGDKLTGTIRAGEDVYQLRPLADGGHVLSRLDLSRMPPDHPADYRTQLVQPLDLDALAEPADKANTVIRVGVLVSSSAASAIGDLTGFANLAIAESNQGFANSGIQVTLQLSYLGTTSYSGTNFSTALSHFAGTSDGNMDSWHATRNSTASDLSVLIINNSSSCGIGYLNSNASTAFSVTHYGCATGYYTFAHEIGHNFGAHHNPEAPANNTIYPYGHGYLAPARTWRTVMAYNCPSGCPRVNYWSNPGVTYGGVPMGTASTHDNARVLNLRRATVAAFR
ncbi:M12 family metallo-peptidase [Luteimonas huabeiensis]|uniref:M12 family metallo-peptidase n=1 Tax=Luteimonas huabeiensis TaxID=1244513 RepID=UPI00046417C3|nr:M12 family metallo-peptidase [Luteimonas huabeiensis]